MALMGACNSPRKRHPRLCCAALVSRDYREINEILPAKSRIPVT